LKVTKKEGLAIFFSPLTTSVSQTGNATLKTIPLKDKISGSYAGTLYWKQWPETLANYASKQENSPQWFFFIIPIVPIVKN